MQKLQNFLANLLVFIFPLFFLTSTQEFFFTNKFYFLGFEILVLLLLIVIQFLSEKKLRWKKTAFDIPIILFVLFYGLSVLISSPNKIQGLLNPVTGFGTVLFLALLYFLLTQSNIKDRLLETLSWSAAIVALLTILSFFNLLAKFPFPQSLTFLKSPAFTPLGGPIDLVLFLGFFVVYRFAKSMLIEKRVRPPLIQIATSLIIFAAFILSAYTLFRPLPQAPNQASNLKSPSSIFQTLPPYSVSWYAAVETLKDPKTAIFGVGPDNFASIYTRVKNANYNLTPLWNLNFTQSRSFIFQIWTETGLFGLVSFLFILFTVFKEASKNKWALGYIFLAFLLFPPSLDLLFLFFILLTAIGINNAKAEKVIDLSTMPLLYASVSLVSLVAIIAAGYFLQRSYVAEYYYKKALDGFPKNNAKEVYDNMRTAIVINPNVERYRENFSQVNFLIANNLASKVATPAGGFKPGQTAPALSESDKQTIGQAVQAAINEAKAAVALNPNKAQAWENLAVIYRNLLNVAQGADSWTVASYQRAIIMDPQNPIYRLNLGGVYFSLKNYEEASRLFSQAAQLKPDWPNAYYNLAWANYQKQDYQGAAVAMDTVLKLLDANKNSDDYKRASTELDLFKKKIPDQTSSGSGQLKLPNEPATQLPRLQLPKLASPEAK